MRIPDERSIQYGDWPARLRDAEELTRYAITTRYPGEDAEVTETEARRGVVLHLSNLPPGRTTR